MPDDDSRSSLRINALRGGAVSEICEFLADFEAAYNALYWFNLQFASVTPRFILVESLAGSLLGGQYRAYSPDQINPKYRLELSKVEIHSPGFWEVLGSLSPLLQIRGYLNDRHERRKDREYREQSEKQKLQMENEILQRTVQAMDLELERKRLQTLRDFGVDPGRFEQEVWSRLGPPMSRLGRHQDTGLISAAHSIESEQSVE